MGNEPGNMSVLTTGAQDWVNNNLPFVGPGIINPLGKFIGTAIGGAAAVGAAGTATINELLSEAHIDPQLQRDLNIGATAIPSDLMAGSVVNPMMYQPRLEPAGPKYAGGVTPAGLDDAAARARVRAATTPPGEAAPSSPTGIEGPRPPPPGYVPPPPPPVATSADAKRIAGQYYAAADNAGGTLTPQFVNKFIDSVGSVAPQTEAGAAVTGTNAVTGLVDRMQNLRDQPMTLAAVQEVDEGLSNLIDKEYGVTGLSKDGKKLLDIQGTLRDQINNAGVGDTTGGTTGFDALNTGRQAWSQAMKMGDLERIQERAALTDNPATSIKTQVRNLITNQSKSRGYTPDEVDALTDAANRGTLGGVLHVFGGRLVPMIAGAAGLSHGPVGGLVAAGMTHAGAGYLRDWATSIQQNRLGNAIGVVGQGVPPPVGPPQL